MKKTFIALMTLVAMTTFAKGIFLISGGDIRKCDSYWKIITTEDNQTVIASPEIEQSFSGNDSMGGRSASLKIDNKVEYAFRSENLPLKEGSTRLIDKIEYTFEKAGVHTIKMYDPFKTVYRINWNDADNKTSPNATLKEFKYISYQPSGGVYISQFNGLCNYSELDTLIVPEGVQALGYLTGGMCPKLTKVVLPDTITDVGSGFWKSENLKEINIPAGVKEIKSLFCQGTAIENLVLPEALEKTSGGAFGGCNKMTTLTILNKNINIGADSFATASGRTTVNGITTINYAGTLEEWNANESLVAKFGSATADGENGIIPENGSIKAKTLNCNYSITR